MNKIEKLLRKISKKDREKLLKLLTYILSGGSQKLKIIKSHNPDFFRLRYGNFRIIFHKQNKEIIIDSIKLRNNKTYKNL